MVTLPNARHKLSYENLLDFPEDDDRRHEIIDGVHFVTASPTLRHQWILLKLAVELTRFVDHQPTQSRFRGLVLPAPTDLVLSRHDVVVPDVVYVRGDRRRLLESKSIQQAPDLVIEVLSPATRSRDLGVKLDLYGRAGVHEYWVVDVEQETVRVFCRARSSAAKGSSGVSDEPLHRQSAFELREIAELSAASGDRLSSVALPGLEIVLDELFETT